MTIQDALIFPFIASIILLICHFAIKIIDMGVLQKFLSVYFAYIGTICMTQMLNFLCGNTNNENLVINKKFSIRIVRYRKDIRIQVNWLDISNFIISLLLAVSYIQLKHWALNNIFAAVFCITGILSIHASRFVIVFVLHVGLFAYDVFWVFQMKIMEEVAQNIELPMKMIFPQVRGVGQEAILGLGDILIPGVLASLCLSFDINTLLRRARHKLTMQEIEDFPTPLFKACLFGYFIGISLSFLALIFFQTAQPALLYIVPSCWTFVLFTAFIKEDFKSFWKYSESAKIRQT